VKWSARERAGLEDIISGRKREEFLPMGENKLLPLLRKIRFGEREAHRPMEAEYWRKIWRIR